MRRLLLGIGAACAIAARAADPGQVIAVEIGPDGWDARIEIAGMTAGGKYDCGLGPNAAPGPGAKLVFNVVSKGFDDQGLPSTITRTVYGATVVNRPYPDQARADETVGDGRLKVRIALSEYVYAQDQVTADFGAGFHTQGGAGSRAVAGLRVVNSSRAPYQPPITNWTAPPHQRITGPFTLRCVAFHRDARLGRPVRAVKFSASDGQRTVERIVTEMTLDPAMSDDAVPAAEYVATLDPASLAQGATITCNYTVYPWIGDEPCSTATGAPQPSPLVGPRPLLCDRTGAYGSAMAKIDPASGDDAAGQAYAAEAYAYPAAKPFKTIAAAARAIGAHHAAHHRRDDVGGGIIELAAGNHAWTDGAAGAKAPAATWLTVRAGPGVERRDCTLAGAAGDLDPGGLVKFENVRIATADDRTFRGLRALWFHRCELDSPAGAVIDGPAVFYVTQCLVSRWIQGMAGGRRGEAACAMSRGNRIVGPCGTTLVHVVMGNLRTGKFPDAPGGDKLPPQGHFTDKIVAAIQPTPILYNNRIMAWRTDAPGTVFGFNHPRPVAFIQNVIENTTPGTSGLGDLCNDGGVDETNGYLVWHNTFLGQRSQVGYNSQPGSGPRHRRYWSMRGNYWDCRGHKSDVFAKDGALTGNWPIMYQVSCSGNVHGGVQAVAASRFHAYFSGLSSIQAANQDGDYPRFVAPRRFAGKSAGEAAGDGDYRLRHDSPLRGLAIDWVLPYDIAGRPRPAVSDTGAFATTQPPPQR